jgi:vacuolar iron transporter family protein
VRAKHTEQHRGDRTGWLRAAVLGANDGVVSTASLMIGVASSGASNDTLLLTGVAGLVAGAMSMAAGEYVSVSSQADTEASDITREMKELDENYAFERDELAAIYVKRGLDQSLAQTVADKLMEANAIQAHTRDELGISDTLRARPTQAALSSASAFAFGAFVPLAATWFAAAQWLTVTIVAATVISLVALGTIAAWVGKAPVATSVARVTVWGILAMALTALVGRTLGTPI